MISIFNSLTPFFMKPKYLAFVAISALLLAGCDNSAPQNPDQNIATQVVTQAQAQTETKVVTQTQIQTQLQTQAQTQTQAIIKSVPPSTQIAAWDTYNDINWGFIISYPKNFQVSGTQGTTIISIAYPESFTNGTNLHNANINVVASKNNGECLNGEFDGKKLTTTEPHNGVTFYVDNWQEGAAGNVGQHYGYVAVNKGNCYRVSLVEYYANMNNYSDGKGGYVAGAPKFFDEKPLISIFKQVFNTFKFTK